MHMSDALITPIVGGAMLATSGGTVLYSIKKIKVDIFEKRLPLMAVMGAFLFAAQMINFSIPGTGSSGHIGGGMLLAIMLGPSAGFLTMACVLLIQALFFADGGLLALGCNLLNLGFFTCYVAYPLVFKPIAGKVNSSKRIMMAAIVASVIGLQLGSLGVVIETFMSGRTELTLGTFLLFMQPIHLAIGLVEGVVTGVIINYLYSQNKEMIYSEIDQPSNFKSYKGMFVAIMIVTLIVGGGVSLFASDKEDGLEWAIAKTTNSEELVNDSTIIAQIEGFQEDVALLPGYEFEASNISKSVGTSVSGIAGSLVTLVITFLIGFAVKKRRRRLESRHE